MSDTQEVRGFETETQQLLQLMIHSLYGNREIFLRELISNASDALDKLRFESYSQPELLVGVGELRIQIDLDTDRGTISVRDNGIGMSRDEVIANIGTIAHSGTAEFAQRLQQDGGKESAAALIGQFGVGFYSAFIVAEKVELFTRQAGLPPEQGVHWASDGKGEYTLDTLTREAKGTEVILHLRDDCKEFADQYRVEAVIHRYSDHIVFPVQMRKDVDGKAGEVGDYEAVNKATALWVKPKAEISDEEYREFYRQFSYDPDDPLAHIHVRVEGNQEYRALLFIPTRAPFDLWNREKRHGVKLYVKRVFIMDDAEHLVPAYLRFLRGIVDSDDLPLNVSREILQSNKLVDSMRAGCVRKVLDVLTSLASDEKEKYQKFWDAFGRVLKEGVVEDTANKQRIAELLRFRSTQGGDSQTVSLADYLARLKDGQRKIYFVTADSYQAAVNSPHLEVFRKHGIEVLLLTDAIDEWVVESLPDYAGKPLQSVAKGELDLDDLVVADSTSATKADMGADRTTLVERLRKALAEQVEAVRVTPRLTESPACLVVGENALSGHLERLMQAAGQTVPVGKAVLEINPDHPLIDRIAAERDEQSFTEWAQVLYDQALLSEGGQLANPAGFVRRINRLLTQTSEPSRIILPS